MGLDWHRLRALVLQSDDWGLCAWVPDERAHRALADGPAFRSRAGQRYGRSTLESAADVRALARVLEGVRGGDGLPAVLQASTIVANPDYDAAAAPAALAAGALPLHAHPALPSRWARPGLWEAVHEAERAGVWWAELHGLHHLPMRAWRLALQRGEDDARHALAHASPICTAAQSGGEYGAAESEAERAADLSAALANNHENVGWGKIAIPEANIHTSAYWLMFDERATSGLDRQQIGAGLSGIGELARNLAPIFCLCDARDIGANVQVRAHSTEMPTVYLYDMAPGGVGLAWMPLK